MNKWPHKLPKFQKFGGNMIAVIRALMGIFGIVLLSMASSARASQASAVTNGEAVEIIRELRRIVAPNGIETVESVHIGGIDQYVSIRSRNPDAPVLLVLHGGPGWVAMPTSWWFAQGWEEYFTVVQWDQRGAGKTFGANDPALTESTLTVERMQSDAEEVVDWARDRFGQNKIFLLGHSWGSILGLRLAAERPQWFHAYVGVGQAIDGLESERRGWAWALDRARANQNDESIRELESIAPYAVSSAPPISHVMLQRKWVNHFGGAAWRRSDAGFEAQAIRLAPEYSQADIQNVWRAQDVSVARLLPDVLETNLAHINQIDVPVFLFLGRHDRNVSASVAQEWYEQLRAPRKELVWFEQSAHEIMVEEPGKTLVSLVTLVLPTTRQAVSTRRTNPTSNYDREADVHPMVPPA